MFHVTIVKWEAIAYYDIMPDLSPAILNIIGSISGQQYISPDTRILRCSKLTVIHKSHKWILSSCSLFMLGKAGIISAPRTIGEPKYFLISIVNLKSFSEKYPRISNSFSLSHCCLCPNDYPVFLDCETFCWWS